MTMLWLGMLILAGAALASCGGNDNTGPIEFLDLRVEQISGARAVVRFDTSIPTSCEVEYGLTKDAMDTIAVDPDMEPGETAIEHRVPLEDLLPETTYSFRATANDGGGRTEYSESMTFTTTDETDPTAGLTNVALISAGASVTEVSSNWGDGDNDSSFGVHNAFDGSMSSEWSTASDGDNAYVELNLGQSRTLQHFGFRSRKMLDETSIVTRVRLLIVDDGNRVLGPFDTPNPDERYVFALEPAVMTQHVRMEAVETSGGNTGAKEIQLYAE